MPKLTKAQIEYVEDRLHRLLNTAIDQLADEHPMLNEMNPNELTMEERHAQIHGGVAKLKPGVSENDYWHEAFDFQEPEASKSWLAAQEMVRQAYEAAKPPIEAAYQRQLDKLHLSNADPFQVINEFEAFVKNYAPIANAA